MEYNYLFEYKNNLSYIKRKEELIKKLGFEKAEIFEYTLEETSLDDILESPDTYSFLTEKKVIIIKNIELLDINKEITKHFFKYLKNPDTNKLLIMISNNLDSRKKITKELKINCNYTLLEDNPINIIKEELKGYDITLKAINLLIEYTNSNIDSIKTECDKLRQYKDIDTEITVEDIKSLCFKHLNDKSNLVFDLVRYISSNNKKSAILAYQELSDSIDDIGVISLLESQLRLLKQVSLLMKKSKRKNDIATILDIHPYRIEKTMELLSKVSDTEINELIKKIGEIDYKIKSGIYDMKKPLEIFLLNL